MPFYVKAYTTGSWKTITKFFVKTSTTGNWKAVQKAFIKGVSGGWSQFWPKAGPQPHYPLEILGFYGTNYNVQYTSLNYPTSGTSYPGLQGYNYHWSYNGTLTLNYLFQKSADNLTYSNCTQSGYTGSISNPTLSSEPNTINYVPKFPDDYPASPTYFVFSVSGYDSNGYSLESSQFNSFNTVVDVTVPDPTIADGYWSGLLTAGSQISYGPGTASSTTVYTRTYIERSDGTIVLDDTGPKNGYTVTVPSVGTPTDNKASYFSVTTTNADNGYYFKAYTKAYSVPGTNPGTTNTVTTGNIVGSYSFAFGNTLYPSSNGEIGLYKGNAGIAPTSTSDKIVAIWGRDLYATSIGYWSDSRYFVIQFSGYDYNNQGVATYALRYQAKFDIYNPSYVDILICNKGSSLPQPTYLGYYSNTSLLGGIAGPYASFVTNSTYRIYMNGTVGSTGQGQSQIPSAAFITALSNVDDNYATITTATDQYTPSTMTVGTITYPTATSASIPFSGTSGDYLYYNYDVRTTSYSGTIVASAAVETANPLSLSGLTENTTYYVTINPYNSMGQIGTQLKFTITTPTAPGSISNIVVKSFSSGNITTFFTTGTNTNSVNIYDNYYVYGNIYVPSSTNYINTNSSTSYWVEYTTSSSYSGYTYIKPYSSSYLFGVPGSSFYSASITPTGQDAMSVSFGTPTKAKTTLTQSWTGNGAANVYDIDVKVGGVSIGYNNGVTYPLTASGYTSVSLTGLTAGTDYVVYVTPAYKPSTGAVYYGTRQNTTITTSPNSYTFDITASKPSVSTNGFISLDGDNFSYSGITGRSINIYNADFTQVGNVLYWSNNTDYVLYYDGYAQNHAGATAYRITYQVRFYDGQTYADVYLFNKGSSLSGPSIGFYNNNVAYGTVSTPLDFYVYRVNFDGTGTTATPAGISGATWVISGNLKDAGSPTAMSPGIYTALDQGYTTITASKQQYVSPVITMGTPTSDGTSVTINYTWDGQVYNFDWDIRTTSYSGSVVTSGTANTNTTSYQITGLSSSTTYYINVYPKNRYGQSGNTVQTSKATAASYTVTYNGNGNTGGSVPTDSTAYASGSTVTAKTNSGTLTKTNYAFAGWNTATDGSGTDYAAGTGTFTISSNTTLYAKWTYLKLVSFDVNGGSGTAPTAIRQSTAGGSITLPAVGSMTGPSGKTVFNGWVTTTSGTSILTSPYTPSGTSDVTLYAYWTAAITRPGTVTVTPTFGKSYTHTDNVVYSATGDTMSVSVSVSGSTATYTYQWQYQSSAGGAWSSVGTGTGATTDTYTVPATYNGFALRCHVSATNSAGTDTGDSASSGPIVNVSATPVTPSGGTVTDTTGVGGTFAWTANSQTVGVGSTFFNYGSGPTWSYNWTQYRNSSTSTTRPTTTYTASTGVKAWNATLSIVSGSTGWFYYTITSNTKLDGTGTNSSSATFPSSGQTASVRYT